MAVTLRRFPGECAGSMSALLEGLQGDGQEILSPLFERNVRERARRRPLQDRAVLYREVSVVARALQPVVFSRVVDRAREMGALLTDRKSTRLNSSHVS